MLSICLKCKKDTQSINPKVSNTIHRTTMFLSKFSARLKIKGINTLIKYIKYTRVWLQYQKMSVLVSYKI